MSAYTTKEITRKEAEELLNRIMYKRISRGFGTDKELEDELDQYAYAGEDEDILGVLYNFKIIN